MDMSSQLLKKKKKKKKMLHGRWWQLHHSLWMYTKLSHNIKKCLLMLLHLTSCKNLSATHKQALNFEAGSQV